MCARTLLARTLATPSDEAGRVRNGCDTSRWGPLSGRLQSRDVFVICAYAGRHVLMRETLMVRSERHSPVMVHVRD